MKLLVPALLLALAPRQVAGNYQVDVFLKNGDPVCTIEARDTPVHLIVEQIARKTGRELDGFQLVSAKATVTTRLHMRPLEQSLHYILGCVGLRGQISSKAIVIRPELPPFPESADLFDAADLGYRKTLAYNPQMAGPDRAEMALGKVQQALGNPSGARSHYDFLVDEHPDSPLVPEALFRAGRILEDLNEWEAAAVTHARLISLDREHEFFARAHLDLARCNSHIGKPERALLHLNDLERRFPAEDALERGRRNYVRARALIGTGDYFEALRLLERRDTRETEGDHPGERIELLAEALELSGRTTDASVAWLEYSQRTTGKEQERAFVMSASLAMKVGDQVGVLMIARQAAREGHGAALLALQNQARFELDLVEGDFSQTTIEQKLAYGERLMQDDRKSEARIVLQPLELTMDQLSAEQMRRFGLAFGAAMEKDQSVDAAIAFLRKVAPRLLDAESRREIYLLAAQLYEDNGLFDKAIEAYGGNL